MGATSFVHVMPKKTAAKTLAAHNFGETRPDEALGRDEWLWEPVRVLVDNREAAADLTKTTRGVRTPGRKGSERVMFLFGHPPAFEAADRWDPDKIMAWARDSVAWLEARVAAASKGAAMVEAATLHLDETTPHVHCTLLPVVHDARGRPRFSWDRVQKAAWPGRSGSQSMTRLQTDYHEAVGRRFGMVRGESSDKRREEPDRLAGLRRRLELTQERLREIEAGARRVAAAARKREYRARRLDARTKGRVRAERSRATEPERGPWR